MNNAFVKYRRVVVFAALLAFLPMVVALVWLVLHETHAPAINQSQLEARLATLTETRAADQQTLGTYSWQNEEKGFIRLPIDRAMQLTVAESSNPAAARAKMVSNAAVLLAVPPPPPSITNFP